MVQVTPGTTVYHPVFGKGSVQQVSETGFRALVNFTTGRTDWVATPFLSKRPLPQPVRQAVKRADVALAEREQVMPRVAPGDVRLQTLQQNLTALEQDIRAAYDTLDRLNKQVGPFMKNPIELLAARGRIISDRAQIVATKREIAMLEARREIRQANKALRGNVMHRADLVSKGSV